MGIVGTFIPGGAGRILVVSHEPENPTDRAILVVPAFAEEMNKSRRLVWETASALCRHGLSTIVPDLFGTGDSEGEFHEARWDIWIGDVCRTLEWMRRGGAKRISVLLVRLGAALFADAQDMIATNFERAVAWQPVGGPDVLRQLLRTKSMAIRMAGGKAEPLESLQQRLLTGTEPMELGGYAVAPELAGALQHAVFSTERIGAIREGLTVEFVAAGSSQPPPQASASGEGGLWQSRPLPAERFWAVVEPRSSPALVEATVNFFAGDR